MLKIFFFYSPTTRRILRLKNPLLNDACLFSYSNPHAAQQQNSGSAQPGEDLTPDYMNVLVNIFKNLKLLTPTHKARLSKDATKKPQYKNILAL